MTEDDKGRILVKLADFDQAVSFEENTEWKINNENHDFELLPPYNCAASLEEKGTLIYFAPEKWNTPFIRTKKTDVFSLGLCLLVLDNYLNFTENDLIKNYYALINPYS